MDALTSERYPIGYRGQSRSVAIRHITGAERISMAAAIGKLAAARHSDPEIGRQLNLTSTQVRRLREEFDIKSGQPVKSGRRPGVVAKRGDCPVCGRDCALDKSGAVGPHRQELVGALGQRKHGDWCEGRGQQHERRQADLLARQHQTVLNACTWEDGEDRESVPVEEIYDAYITDPAHAGQTDRDGGER